MDAVHAHLNFKLSALRIALSAVIPCDSCSMSFAAVFTDFRRAGLISPCDSCSMSFAAVFTDFRRAGLISTTSDDELSSATVGGVHAAPLANAAMIGDEENMSTFSWTLARVSLGMLVLER
jgi:hypothetical protein